MVAPYTPTPRDDDDLKKPVQASIATLGSRYKTNTLDDDDVEACDFSRDEEDIGIGIDDDRMGVLFDEEDLFGAKGKKVKTNKSKMLLDELEGGGFNGHLDTDQSYVNPTL